MLTKPQILNEFLHIKQNIPFKLKNVYTSALNVKKGLKFQVNSSYITAGQKGTLEKAQLPPKSNFKPVNVDFGASRNIAHYNKNPLTTNNKTSKAQISYTPDSSRSILFVDNKVITLKDFVKEKISLNLTNEANTKPEKNKRNWADHNLQLEPSFQKMVDIGVEIFNLKAVSGISYIVFIKHIKNTPPAIAKFLHNQRNFNEKTLTNCKLVKKDKIQITSFLTNLNIKEILEILSFYTESFIFRDMSFVSALKFFLNNFIIENDPEKIDILLYAFSRKYFKELKKIKAPSDNIKDKTPDDQEYIRKIFQNFDAVHMLAFVTIMLDIEIHHAKRKDLENVIKEFNMNVKGLNDGENFPKEFIDSIVENVLTQKLVVLRENDEKKQKETKEKKSVRDFIMQEADLLLLVKKKKNNSKELIVFQMVMIENLGFLFKNNNEETPFALFVLENCNVKVKGLNFSLVANEKKSNKLIIYGKFNEYDNGTICVKYKDSIEFLLMEANDAKKIVKYVEKMNEVKNIYKEK